MTHIYQKTMIVALVAFALFAGALTFTVALPGVADAGSGQAASSAIDLTPAMARNVEPRPSTSASAASASAASTAPTQVCFADGCVTAPADTATER